MVLRVDDCLPAIFLFFQRVKLIAPADVSLLRPKMKNRHPKFGDNA